MWNEVFSQPIHSYFCLYITGKYRKILWKDSICVNKESRFNDIFFHSLADERNTELNDEVLLDQ